jgi:hypothetical protein
MVPARIVVLPALPLRANGKVDRDALPPPDGERPSGDGDYVAPSGPLETVLADAWADVLGLRRVGATDDFFADLGGHSLLATQLASRLRDLFQVDMPLRTVFEAPTVAGMAAALLSGATAADAERIQESAALLLRVRGMSEDEAERVLRSLPAS